MSTELKGLYTGIKNNIVKAAEKVPEESYSFKPSPDVRTFAQLVGHVADAQYLFCTAGKPEAEQKKAPGAEKKLTTKAEPVAALKDGFAYCDAAYDKLTDANATSMQKLFGRERSMMGILSMKRRAQQRTLRQHGHLHAHKGNCSPFERRPLVSASLGSLAGFRHVVTFAVDRRDFGTHGTQIHR